MLTRLAERAAPPLMNGDALRSIASSAESAVRVLVVEDDPFQLEDLVQEGHVCVAVQLFLAGARAAGTFCASMKGKAGGCWKACCRCKQRRRQGQKNTKQGRERDPDSDAESVHEGEGYCQMMRVVFANPTAKGLRMTCKGACSREATTTIRILKDDMVLSDVADFFDEAVGCVLALVSVEGCAIL